MHDDTADLSPLNAVSTLGESLTYEPIPEPSLRPRRAGQRKAGPRRGWRQCHGKHRYETRHAAWRAMQSFRRRHPSHYHMSVYWCGGCAYFHCGHDVTRPKEARPC